MSEQPAPFHRTLTKTVIMGLPVHPATAPQALSWVRDQVTNGTQPQCILAANPEKVYHLQKSEFLRSFFSSAGLCIPDGIGIVLALRFLQGTRTRRLPGADLMQSICQQAPKHGHKIFLYGSTEEVSQEASDILMQRYPGLAITGRANGFRTDMPDLVSDINRSQADILFVALGSPRQEEWVSKYGSKLTTVKVIQCIGGTLDTITGRVPRAPRIFRAIGLEWFYRLIRQPSRLPRQLILGRFAMQVITRKLRGIDPALPPA